MFISASLEKLLELTADMECACLCGVDPDEEPCDSCEIRRLTAEVEKEYGSGFFAARSK